MMIITRPTRKKAHHIPALKIVSIAPQPVKTKRVKTRAKKKDDIFIEFGFLLLKSQLLYHFIFV
jgi:hypothetical protein